MSSNNKNINKPNSNKITKTNQISNNKKNNINKNASSNNKAKVNPKQAKKTIEDNKITVEKRADNRFIEPSKEVMKKEDAKEEKISETKKAKKNKKVKIILIILIAVIILLIGVALSILIYLNNLEKFKDVTLELGNANVTIKDFLKDATNEADTLLITDLKTIDFKNVGTFKIQISYNGVVDTVNLTIEDTIPPTLELQNKEIYINEKITKEDFIKETYDISGSVETTLDTEIDVTKEGEQKISITAKDKNGNKITKETTLTVKKDKVAPKFSGLTALTVKKNAKINYTNGVKAIDDKDGSVDFTYDASKVDPSKQGSYYVTYTAVDKSGNKATAKRKITVDHDDEDTKALVEQIAATLSSDPEELRDYCRNKIKYDHYDGGDDALYYGLTYHKGNCYVHAQCFKALLDAKGIENQLIWVTNKTHYWNLVKINGVWRHMDSTPDRNHRKISIMTDEQRLSTLSGRKWDFSAWPAAN